MIGQKKYEDDLLFLACSRNNVSLVDEILKTGFEVKSTKYMDACDSEEILKKVWCDKLSVPAIESKKRKIVSFDWNEILFDAKYRKKRCRKISKTYQH